MDLTITNNLIAATNKWEISAEECLSDHNHLKYKTGVGEANDHNNDNKCQGIKCIIKENKLHKFDRKLVQEVWKMAPNKNIEGGVEELDRYLSTITTTENDLEQHVDIFAEAIQSACKRTFQNTHKGKKNSKKKSVPWWMESLTTKRKRVNACRRLYQRIRNDGRNTAMWQPLQTHGCKFTNSRQGKHMPTV